MKPWEETWSLDDHPNWRNYNGSRVETPDGAIQFGEEHGPRGETWFEASEAQAARAKLAAAAPEMARLLLGLAANWHHDRPPIVPMPVSYYRCESCESEVVKPGSAEKHMDDCELVAVLRKAGVLEPGDT